MDYECMWKVLKELIEKEKSEDVISFVELLHMVNYIEYLEKSFGSFV